MVTIYGSCRRLDERAEHTTQILLNSLLLGLGDIQSEYQDFLRNCCIINQGGTTMLKVNLQLFAHKKGAVLHQTDVTHKRNV